MSLRPRRALRAPESVLYRSRSGRQFERTPFLQWVSTKALPIGNGGRVVASAFEQATPARRQPACPYPYQLHDCLLPGPAEVMGIAAFAWLSYRRCPARLPRRNGSMVDVSLNSAW